MKIHFIGCLGTSMRFLMDLCKKNGALVSGSDSRLLGHKANNVEGADLVVYSLAIGAENPELIEAKNRGIPTLSRAQLLGIIAKNYDTVIAVAGTHGKSTTTAMLWEIFDFACPTVHLGGCYKGKNGWMGDSKILITEACEYRRAFLSLAPDIAVVLNVEYDHVDCYSSLNDVHDAFCEFEKNSKIVLRDLQFVLQKNQWAYSEICNTKQITYGYNSNYCATNIERKDGCYSFDFCERGEIVGRIELTVPGVHNAKNALYASAAAHCYGVGFDRIKKGLKNFVGVNGRLEFLGSKNGKAVYTDYAHHPSEIAATKVALAECGYQSIMAVFEPHTYSRTKTFFDSLSRELSAFDFVAVLPIFAAREQGDEKLAENLGQSIAKNSSCCFCSSQRDLFDRIEMNSCDAVVFMGAGRADQIAKTFLRTYSGR